MTLQELLNHLDPSSLLRRRAWVVILVAVGSFAFSPQTRAACDSPDPGCPGGNLAEGYLALASLSSGTYNTGIGIYSLLSNTTGGLNTGVGAGALFSNTGNETTATGAGALLSNTSGNDNTANGAFALVSNSTGQDNTAIGARALLNHTSGDSNTAVGEAAMLNDSTGSNNIAIGVQALGNNDSGSFNIVLGNTAGTGVTTASNVICIGASGANVGNSCYINGIWGQTIDPATAVLVGVDEFGKLGTVASSRTLKCDIKPMDKSSDPVLRLKPVTFHYKSDVKRTPCFGLIAEEVAQVSPDLVVRDKEGKPVTVRYDQVNTMLLNEFLKEHDTVQELKQQVAALTATVKAQASLIRKVSDKVELNRPVSQVAESNQ
jgi:hypothetical protein